MGERLPAGDRNRQPAAITGMAAVSAYGRGVAALTHGALSGCPAFAEVSRFDVSTRRVTVAATLDESPVLLDELLDVVDSACAEAGLSPAQRAASPLLLAVHGDPALPRAAAPERGAHTAGAFAATIAAKCGLSAATRAYTSACVAASSAVADAAAMVARGEVDRVVAAAGYLVDPDQFALFDAGRALASDGAVRPFSAGRKGLLLGDGVAAVVVESARAAAARGASALAWLPGWGRSGDAYHVVQPRPDGEGLARAIEAALRRAAIGPDDIGYVNAHGSGSVPSDAAESQALVRIFGPAAGRVPVSSTKSLHGQALEASPLVELVLTVSALHAGRLPVNAGFLGPDEACPVNLILDTPAPVTTPVALCLNAAFGGANTALVVSGP